RGHRVSAETSALVALPVLREKASSDLFGPRDSSTLHTPMPAYATVVFDCDSTLSDIEGIDVLAADHREAVARLTDAAMQGELPLEEVYGRRLALVRPDRARIEALAREYVDRLVPDAREVVAALLANGVEVRVVSGGLLPAVRAVARELGIADEMVAAVDLRFDADGAYAGF